MVAVLLICGTPSMLLMRLSCVLLYLVVRLAQAEVAARLSTLRSAPAVDYSTGSMCHYM
jgi:hypothetical protein